MYTLHVPVRLRRNSLVDWVPIVMFGNGRDTTRCTVRLTPCVGAGQMSARVDAAFMEVFRTLPPLHDWEALNSRSCPQNRAFLLR